MSEVELSDSDFDVDLLDYLFSLRKYILVSALVLFVSIILGFFLPDKLGFMVSDSANSFAGSPSITLFFTILVNNFIALGLVILTGFLFGVLPLIVMALNGFMIGAVAYNVASAGGLSNFLLGVFPHGVIEIPLTILVSAMGLRIGHDFVKRSEWIDQPVKADFKASMEVFIWIVLPLMTVSAIIETYITTLLV